MSIVSVKLRKWQLHETACIVVENVTYSICSQRTITKYFVILLYKSKIYLLSIFGNYLLSGRA